MMQLVISMCLIVSAVNACKLPYTVQFIIKYTTAAVITKHIPQTGSGKSGLSAYGGGTSGADWKLPQKLQIVKPIEGSLTLHQWSRLATPHLGGLLEEREGVAIKVRKKRYPFQMYAKAQQSSLI